MVGEDHLLAYFGAWQCITCLFAFLGLLAIWYHIGRKQHDFGQVWLALSILCWAVSGYLEWLYGFQFSNESKNSLGLINLENSQQYQSLKLNGFKSVLSLFNSLFILLALPWFKHLPKFLETMIKSKYWPLIVGLPFVFSLLPTLSRLLTGKDISFISELDVYYSILTLLVLGAVLWESFMKRRLALLAYLSAICIVVTFAAQIFKLTDSTSSQILFSAIFKSSLIMIFFALALSWVKDLSEKVNIKSSDLSLRLFKEKVGRSFKNKVVMSGLKSQPSEIEMTTKYYELLVKFISRLKNGGDGWLEIKPKSETRSGKIYDINDYNEIKRLLHAILDGVYGKNSWSKTEHEEPLKDAIFEKAADRDRQIRLKLDPSKLEIQ